MRTMDQVTSRAPKSDVTVYIMLDNFGRLGSAYRETDEEYDLENVTTNMLHGEYNDPKRVVAFNTAEKWSSDVSEDVAWEVPKRVASQGLALPATRSFCEFHVGLRETALAESARISALHLFSFRREDLRSHREPQGSARRRRLARIASAGRSVRCIRMSANAPESGLAWIAW